MAGNVSTDFQKKIEKYCVYQDRCQAEVIEKLKQLGCNWRESQELLTELITSGFVNDERFAKSFAGGHFRMKGWGRVKIRAALKARHISDPNIRIALMKEIPEDEYLKTLDRQAQKKIRLSTLNLKDLKDQNILFRFLIQKGFESEIIQKWLQNLKGNF